MVEIKRNLVQTYTVGSKLYAKGKIRNAWVGMSGTNSATEIAIHQTGNISKGANAEMHGKLQANGNSRTAGWHYTVDDTEAVQSFPHSARVYHTGTTHGHKNAIAVEICINSDGNYKKAIANAAELVKQLMQQENIGIDKVKRHYDYSGKICPAQIMDNQDGISWADFKSMLKGEADTKYVGKPTSSKSKPTTKKANTESVQDWMNANKSKWGDGSFKNRKSVATKHAGIKDYSGTANQNIQLLKFVKSNSHQPTANTESVQDWMNANKSKWGDGSFKNRKSVATKHAGIKDYSGTANQNIQLLKFVKSNSHQPTAKKVSGKVSKVQQWLNKNYNTKIAEDNSFGPNTKKALIKALQSEMNKQYGKNLAVDGSLGKNTKSAILSVKRGAKGNITRVIQGALICKGYGVNGFDGSFGAGLESAIKRFQKASGLSVDGIAGRNTITKLLS